MIGKEKLEGCGGKRSWPDFKLYPDIYLRKCGRAIAQAVSHWLPTAAARVRAWVWSCGICGLQSGAGAGFLRILRFPLPMFFPPIAPQSPSSIIWGLYNRPEVAAVPRDLVPPYYLRKSWVSRVRVSAWIRTGQLPNIFSWKCSHWHIQHELDHTTSTDYSIDMQIILLLQTREVRIPHADKVWG
jgi:hypothetical protein